MAGIRVELADWQRYNADQSSFWTLCEFMGHWGGVTRKMAEEGIPHVYIQVRAPWHPIGQRH